MSEFREDLLISPINKKRVIGIFLVTILLISLFAFSVLLYSLLFGSQRPFPSDQLSEAEYEEGNPVFIPIPFNWSDIFDNLNLSQDQLQDLLDSLQDMFDGDIDDLDLGNFSQSILGLLASEIEVFRVFYYSDFNAMTNKLWKYECFDEYTGDGWHSTASTQNYNFYSYNDWLTYHSDKDLLKIKMPLTPTLGINSMVAPTLFPNPYVIDGSVSAPNMVLTAPDDPKFYKDDFNSTTMDLTFISEADVNMSYYMFGLNLPSNDDINNSAVGAIYTPPVIQNRYLQLPLALDAYLTNNYFVNDTLVILNNTINEYDNAFVVANKIRNHLQTYFTFPIDPNSYNPAPPGRDAVDWFCETKQGVWSDFASAFSVFCRIFGVASRFVDGFNSFGIQEISDPIEGANGFAIKYKNLYNWAEIYVPSDYFGNGQWVQMDIIFDSFGTGGSPVTGGDYNISVYTDRPFPAVYYRLPETANITAYLSSSTEPIDNIGITFRDLSTGELLGNDYTDPNGQSSILININDSKVVGHHLIEARVNPVIVNYTLFTIAGDIQVNLTLVTPTMVNRSDTAPDITNVQGYLYDPVANKRVKDAEVNFKLLQIGTNNEIFNAFIPSTQFTDPNGEFNEILNINPSVPAGQYEIRVDFNGTWMLPIFYVPFTSIVPITNSSQRREFNITKVLSLLFYINSYPANDPNNPLVFRNDPLILNAIVMLENVGPVQGKRVFFHDWTRGGIELGSAISDVTGSASITIPANNSFTAGPNLLYARHNLQENYSYFILNEEPTINIFSGPVPREINRTGSGATNTWFNIEGEILDATNLNPLGDCILRLRLFSLGGSDYSSNLLPSESFYTDFNGYFNLNFEVDSNTPIGNYTLRLDFNGTMDRNWVPMYPYFFNLPILSTSSNFAHELLISTPATLSFNFWINGTTSDNYNQPIINYNDHLDLSVNLTWGGAPIGDGELIEFYDVTQDRLIDAVSTSSGFAQTLYITDFSTIAGPHQICARWGSYYNFSYFILNEQIIVDFESGPVPREISRGQTSFNLHGYVNDSLNHSPIKYAEISVHLYYGSTEVFGYLIHESGSLQLDNTGEFDLYYSVSGSTPEQNYTIKVEFNGIFLYSYPPSNNPHDFYLFLPNFYDIVNASHELKVIDPDNLDIYLSVEGNPTLPFYDNGKPPETYYFGQQAHFQVQIVHAESKIGRSVTMYDDYSGSPIQSYIFTSDTGFVQFNVSTNNLHAGLNRIRVNYHTFPTFNITYVVVNETFTISPNAKDSVLRNFDNFDVNTYVRDGTINLNGLEITILLLDNTFSDVSFYLNLAGPQTITVYNGYYQFNINSILLNCPEGQYYLRIDFYGNLFDAGISLFNYMAYEISSPIPINVSAGTTLSGNYDTRVVKDQFYEGDDLYAYGYLRWDNGTEIAFKNVTVTIRDNLGFIITSKIGSTDINGFFNITIVIGAAWPDDAEVWVSFYPEDNFTAPRYYFIKSSEQQLFRP